MFMYEKCALDMNYKEVLIAKQNQRKRKVNSHSKVRKN